MGTRKLYDIDAYATEFEAKVLSCKVKDQKNDDADLGEVYEVILDQTLFFPEEGGQTPDRGTLSGQRIVDVQIRGEEILHYIDGPLEEGAAVTGQIDWEHRFDNMQQHSAEHIFSGIADCCYGSKNVGFHLSDQIVTMDFDRMFAQEELEEMEMEVNRAITANAAIRAWYPSKEELDALEYRSKIRIEGDIRIVEIEGYDRCACCAPHVHHTGEIGMFKIQTAQNYKGGTRISFVCGFRALKEYRRKSQIISELSAVLTTNQENLPEHVTKLKTHVQSLKSQINQVKQGIMMEKIMHIPGEQKDVLLFERDLEAPVMRAVVNQLQETHGGICAVFVGDEEEGYHYILGSRHRDCREIAKKLRENLQARGGGSAEMIQGSVHASADQIKQTLL